jgi:hypothetical protein
LAIAGIAGSPFLSRRMKDGFPTWACHSAVRRSWKSPLWTRDDVANDIALDADGNVYMTGQSISYLDYFASRPTVNREP